MGKAADNEQRKLDATFYNNLSVWPAPGSEDTKLGVLMEREVRHGASEIYAGVQA